MKIDITIQKIFRVSWVANSFNGIFGFGGLVGAGLRVMLYCSYVQDNGKLIKNITWMTTAFITGLSFLSFLGLIGVLNIWFLLQEKPWLWPALVIFAFLVPVYIGISKVKRKKEKDREGKASTAVLYSLVSLVEWLSASIVMYVIVLESNKLKGEIVSQQHSSIETYLTYHKDKWLSPSMIRMIEIIQNQAKTWYF